MRYFIPCMAILTFCVTTTSAAASVGYAIDPNHPGKCVLKHPELIMSPGERYDFPKGCGVIMCGIKSIASIYSCGLIGVPNGCKLTKILDSAAVYPDCCPKGYTCNDISDKEVKK